MGWFDGKASPAPQKEAKYSVEKVEALLDRFGPMRLGVRDARLKVLITRVTWGAIPYLTASSGGKPNGEQLARMMTTLTMLIDTLEGYVKIQNNPAAYKAQGGADALLRQGFLAVEQYSRQLSDTDAASSDVGSYTALTDYLTGNTPPI